jgi:RNA-directed DNA polymerase
MLPETVEKAIGSLPTVVRSGRRANGLFRLMKSPSLWDQAYLKVAANKGAMTPGIDGRTFDGYRPRRSAPSSLDYRTDRISPLLYVVS